MSTTVAPIDTESSVEAQVFISMVAKGKAVSDINTIDLRARIDQNVAAAEVFYRDEQGEFAHEFLAGDSVLAMPEIGAEIALAACYADIDFA